MGRPTKFLNQEEREASNRESKKRSAQRRREKAKSNAAGTTTGSGTGGSLWFVSTIATFNVTSAPAQSTPTAGTTTASGTGAGFHGQTTTSNVTSQPSTSSRIFGTAATASTHRAGSQAANTQSGFGNRALFALPYPFGTNLLREVARFNDSKYSDATVHIQDVTLPVHKLVVCTQSKYFERAFARGFQEGDANAITFNEGSAAAHWRVFEYLYTGTYSDTVNHSRLEDDPALVKDTLVYALADIFFLDGLKTLALSKLKYKLLTSCQLDDSFLECVREVYASTHDASSPIRSAVVATATTHSATLMRKDSFQELLREGGDFPVEYVNALMGSNNSNQGR